MNKTSIGWCSHTINPIRARLATATDNRSGHYCEKISTECSRCYASAMQPRLFGLPEFQEQRKLKGLDLFLDQRFLAQVHKHKAPARLFWCDMTDMFGDWVPEAWIATCFATMRDTPWITHLVLTKRAKRMHDLLRAWFPAPLPNVHLGVSAGTQAAANALIPWLIQTPTVLPFLSVEPLLEPLQIGKLGPWQDPRRRCPVEVYPLIGTMAIPDCDWDVGKIGWVIMGGESGPRHRPMEVDWLAVLAQECLAHKVPVYVKQDAALRPGQQGRIPDYLWALKQLPVSP
jgi:protein gp37